MRSSCDSAAGHAARGVFAEHQVGGVEFGEGLFVLALHRGLHRRAERGFDRVDQVEQRQLVERRDAARRARRRGCAARAAWRRGRVRKRANRSRPAPRSAARRRNRSAKRSALSWRDNAADAGHVLEYSTANPSARCRCPSREFGFDRRPDSASSRRCRWPARGAAAGVRSASAGARAWKRRPAIR